MILIYSEEITPRINYAFHLIFTQILQVEISVTSDSSEFQKSNYPKINYSSRKFGSELYIKPHGLLQQKTIAVTNIQSVRYKDDKYFFESSKDSILPFDPFAASFYLVTRYEEYLESDLDKFGRYSAANSILTKYDLLKKPVVNIWARLTAHKIKLQYPELAFPENKFEFISTIDIDNAWAVLHKGFLRSGGAILKAFTKGHFSEIKSRLSVLKGKQDDPYNTYSYLDSILEKHKNQVKFFFLLGNYGKFDKNISHKNRYFQNLIKQIAWKYDTGIHPSFVTGEKGGTKKIISEKQRLEKITGNKIVKSRQHFLRLSLPKTYRRLINAGISEDYTLGYPEQTGFRAGICTPFYFYDLKKEEITNLKIIPFQVMDVTLRDYLELGPEESLSEIIKLMKEVKDVGGTFVSIWHNETVTDLERWKGFRKVFEEMNITGFKWSND